MISTPKGTRGYGETTTAGARAAGLRWTGREGLRRGLRRVAVTASVGLLVALSGVPPLHAAETANKLETANKPETAKQPDAGNKPATGKKLETAGKPETVNMAERSLKKIVERQREVFAEASKQGDKLDEESFRQQVQSITHDYELLLRNNPSFAAAYAAYGYLLGKVDMRKEATSMLLKANQLDPDIALVKNQLGNMLAEDGKPLQAAPYYIAAIKLEPNEPLYHYQLGTVLSEARADFLKTGEWTRDSLDSAMHHAFQRAAELAPDRFEFAYRFAESFYDLEKPDWNAALKAWSALEEKAPTSIERQTMRLHAANVCLKLGKRDHARALLDSVDDPKLQGQKDRLLPQLADAARK